MASYNNHSSKFNNSQIPNLNNSQFCEYWECEYCGNKSNNETNICEMCEEKCENRVKVHKEVAYKTKIVHQNNKVELCKTDSNKCVSVNEDFNIKFQFTKQFKNSDHINNNLGIDTTFLKTVCDIEKNSCEIGHEKINSINLKSDVEDPVNIWNCLKCSKQNSFNLKICSLCNCLAPHLNKWKCHECTFVNENCMTNCSACHIRRIVNIDKSIKINLEENMDDLCMQCSMKLQLSEEKLCYKCSTKYYLCENKNCGKLVRFNQLSCTCEELNLSRNRNVDFSSGLSLLFSGQDAQKQRCRQCSVVLISLENKLCYNCRTKYCICSNDICGKIINLNEKQCVCGVIITPSNSEYKETLQVINRTDDDEKVLVILSDSTINYISKENQCINCKRVKLLCANKLCCQCNEEFFICARTKCGKVVNVNRPYCHCGEINPLLNKLYLINLTKPHSIHNVGKSFEKYTISGINKKLLGKDSFCHMCQDEICTCDKCSASDILQSISTSEKSTDNQGYVAYNDTIKYSRGKCGHIIEDKHFKCDKCHGYCKLKCILSCKNCEYIQSINDECTICKRKSESWSYYIFNKEDSFNNSHKSSRGSNKYFFKTNDLSSYTSLCDKEHQIKFCKHCQEAFCHSKDNICSKCKEEYFECPNEDCGRIVGPWKLQCEFCNTEIWQCSWRKCRQFNDKRKINCVDCYCLQDYLSDTTIKCVICGWVRSKNISCDKCNYEQRDNLLT